MRARCLARQRVFLQLPGSWSFWGSRQSFWLPGFRALLQFGSHAHAHAYTRTHTCVHYQVNRVFAMPRSASPAAPTLAPGRRIQTRRSGVHGKGVFAVQDIAEGEVLVEYTGEVIGWQEAQDRHPHDPLQPNHTFYFHVDEDHVIDAKFGGGRKSVVCSCDLSTRAK